MHEMPQILFDLLSKTGQLCSNSSNLNDRADRDKFPYFLSQIRTAMFFMLNLYKIRKFQTGWQPWIINKINWVSHQNE